MFAILAEDDSDAEALSYIVKRHFKDDRLPIRRKGYDGCATLCRKGARDIKTWRNQGISRFVVCHDSDLNPPEMILEKVMTKIVRPAGVTDQCCIAVPVQEIEAWLIADEEAISSIIPTFRFNEQLHPESIADPKEWLVKQSKAANGKPLYSPKTFNAKVARLIRLDVVQAKCPSFKAFLDCLGKKP